jgi:hypothetical protein
MTDREKFETICDLTTKLVGLQQGILSDKTRAEKIHIPRMVASVVARLNEIHPITIAEVIKRDRTSVLHYYKKHEDNLKSYIKYREMFFKVYSAYEDIHRNKKLFKNKNDLRMYLVSQGIIMKSKKSQVIIIVKSGKVNCEVKTRYRLCSDLIEDLKNVLKYHNFSLEMKTIK